SCLYSNSTIRNRTTSMTMKYQFTNEEDLSRSIGKNATPRMWLVRVSSPPSITEMIYSPFFFFSSRRRHTRSKRDWSSDVCSSEGICEIHRRFCAELPEALLWVEDPENMERVRVVPGELRKRDVKVGGHVAISAGAVPRFLKRFEHVYNHLGKTDSILAAAPAHHRLLWIHPFLDGNGRVARLMSHASLLETLDTGAVWSVARGLARNVEEYKRHLAACDGPRRNDLDGRGNLSEEALAAFTEFFLKTCIDQVSFMESLMQPDRLRARILLWAEEEIKLKNLPRRSGR